MNEKQRAALDAIGAAQSAIAEAVEELRVSLTPEAPPAPAPELDAYLQAYGHSALGAN